MTKNITLLTALIFILTACATSQKTITPTIAPTTQVKKTEEKEEKIPAPIKYNDVPRFAELKNFTVSAEYFPSVGQDERIRHLVLHYTAIDTETSIRALTRNQVSSHYLVTDGFNDPIYAFVDENKRAWHAGVSSWKGINNINFSSIGIEIVNFGGYTDDGSEGDTHEGWKYTGFYEYPAHQINKVAALAKDIIERYNIDPVNVVGHSDIAPQRKPDPGPKFPWKKLYQQHGIGAWYEDAHKYIYMPQFPYDRMNEYDFVLSVQNDLEKYGYAIEKTGEWDTQTRKVITVFQYHFRPEVFDGVMDAETWAILQALILKYRT